MHSAQLSAIDVTIVVAYGLATTLLGVWFARRQRDLNTYFVGDREVSWWLVLVSIVATETSTVTFLSVPGVAYNPGVPGMAYDPRAGNLTFLQLAMGYVVGRCLIAWLLLPQYVGGKLVSAYQLLRQRFSTQVQRTASGIFLLTRAVADGLRLYLAALLLHQFTGWDTPTSILVIGAATMIYTFLGGMQAVIWTDLIQFVIYITGAVVAACFILWRIEGGWDGFVATGEAHHKFHVFYFSADPSWPYTFWAGLIGGAVFTMASHGADQMMVQRYLCSRSLTEARAALVGSGLVVFVQFSLFLLIGVGLFVLREQGTLPKEMAKDEVFGHFIVNFLPTGVVGMLVAAVLAASMATLASSLNSGAGAFVADFYRPLRPGHSEQHYLRVSRGMTSFWGLTRIGVALLAVPLLGMEKKSVIDEVLRVAGFTTGMILGLFLLGSLRRPVDSRAALAGVVVGFLTVLDVWLRGGLAWPWYAVVGTLVTVAVALVVDRLGIRRGPFADRGAEPRLDQLGRVDAVAARAADER
jgi:SSS family transporter